MSNTKQSKRVTPASSETLLTLLETLPGALFVIDDDATNVYANASAQAMLGSTREDLCGKSLWSCAPQLVSTSLYQAVLKARQTRKLTKVEYCSPVTQTWLQAQLLPTRVGLAIFFQENTEPTRLQDALCQSEQKYLDLLEGISEQVAVLTPEGLVLEISQRSLVDAHLRREEVVGKPFTETPWWSYAPPVQQQLRAAIEQASRGEIVHFEARIRSQEGWYLDLAVTIIPHLDADKQVEYLIYTGLDITARKRTEDEIRVLIDAIPQFVWVMHPNGSTKYSNQQWRDYTNTTLEQLQGDEWIACLHPDDRQRTQEAWRTSIQTGAPYEVEQRLRNGTTGDYRWFLARAVPYKDDHGQIVKWLGTSTDIDERKRMEEALRQSQERANILMNSSIIGITINEGEQIVNANDTFLRMTGYTREDLCAGSLNWLHMTPPDYLARTLEARQELAAQRSVTYEKEYVCKDGSRLPVVIGHVLLQAHPFQTIGFVLDNSARKELEQRKDDFINMASHELRGPLTALKLQTTLLHRQLAKQGLQDSAPALSRIDVQLNKITRLVEELLDVSKIQAGRLEYRQERVDLDGLLQEITDTMQQSHPSHTIVVHGAARVSLMADRDRLGEVFINLISNAIKYSPDAETVEIDLDASPETVTIRVHDHGLGIPREQRDKIFEQFYRVAGPKQRVTPGLGIGLYIVAEIVKHYGGTITVDSTVGKGSTFTVTLPREGDA